MWGVEAALRCEEFSESGGPRLQTSDSCHNRGVIWEIALRGVWKVGNKMKGMWKFKRWWVTGRFPASGGEVRKTKILGQVKDYLLKRVIKFTFCSSEFNLYVKMSFIQQVNPNPLCAVNLFKHTWPRPRHSASQIAPPQITGANKERNDLTLGNAYRYSFIMNWRFHHTLE